MSSRLTCGLGATWALRNLSYAIIGLRQRGTMLLWCANILYVYGFLSRFFAQLEGLEPNVSASYNSGSVPIEELASKTKQSLGKPGKDFTDSRRVQRSAELASR